MHVAVDSVNHWLSGRVPGMALDEDHVAALSRADGTVIVIEVEPAAGIVHLSSVVCPMPEDSPEDALFAALQLNRFGRALGGCWLAWDDGLQVFLLCHNSAIRYLDELGFNHTLDNFLSAVHAARQVLAPPVAQDLSAAMATA